MGENNKDPKIALTDAERFPLLHDFTLLNALRQDEHAPRFNFRSGDRLDATRLERVITYAAEIRGVKRNLQPSEVPAWMDGFLQTCLTTVPFYKGRTGDLIAQPAITRNDLREQPWNFVSIHCDLNDLLVYKTSGTTGAPVDVLFDAVSQARWLPQLQAVLDDHHIAIGDNTRKVAVALICAQESTLTYASLSAYLDGAGILKINLNPAEWRDPSDRLTYLEKYNPEILTGDPFAFLALLSLQPKISPKALVSSAMKLTDGVKAQLESYFKAPVFDIYSLTECRMIAVAENGRYKAIRPELYLEVLDKQEDTALPDGELGELAITGLSTAFLPLIRYRTGDFCRLATENGTQYLWDLEARKQVCLYSCAGKLINTIDVSRELSQYPLAGYTLHQRSDLGIVFEGWSNEPIAAKISASLYRLFGSNAQLTVRLNSVGPDSSNKAVTYSTDVITP